MGGLPAWGTTVYYQITVDTSSQFGNYGYLDIN
jgi:hypothetical protein